MPKKSYDNNSIRSRKGADRVRKAPGVVFGSDGLEGCQQTVFEILSNAVDEAREGYGDTITLTCFPDQSIQVEDHGRGCPMEWNEEEGKNNWELVFCELYAGGKYDEGEGDYNFSLGTNGLGACSTQYASEYFDVVVYRDGFKYTLHFEHGKIVGDLHKEPTDQGDRTGTIIHWKPDPQVFSDTDIPQEYFSDMLKRQAAVNDGVTFKLRKETADGRFETETFYYENGIAGYVEELAGEDRLTDPVLWKAERQGRDSPEKAEYKLELNLVMCFSNRVQVIEHYHNSSWLVYGGSPDKATRDAMVSAVDSYLKKEGKYQKNESKVTWNDIRDCLVLVTSNFSPNPSYENQTKKAVRNKFIVEAMTDFIKSRMEVYFSENPDDARKIGDQVLINKRSRETAEKTRLNVKKKMTGNTGLSNRVQKFVDCRTRDVARRELYIVEGDSALGSVKLSRDAEFQGIMPVRGKILNCLKVDYARIFKSGIITDLIRVLGCGVSVKDKRAKDLPAFSLDNLKWSKVIICTDADVDGFQIRTLILAMLYRLTPELIEKGYVYIAESPLYEIIYKEKTWFAYSDAEKDEIVNGEELAGKKVTINRSKGLGENSPEMMWMTTMNPETRRLIRVMPEDAQRTAEVFDRLLGDNLQGRKDYLAEVGYQYLNQADIS